MHNYINYKLLRDFSKEITVDIVEKDLTEIYNIQNIDFDEFEAFDLLLSTLYDDYKNKRCNYIAFIEKGMNARILFELRRNALLKFEEAEQIEFCRQHNNCDTVEQIKELRIKAIRKYNKDYEDADWQYAWLASHLWCIDISKFYFDFDICFKDKHSTRQRLPEDYREEFNEHSLNSYKKYFPRLFEEVE